MAALGKLVAGVVHELNTPIGAAQSSHESLVRATEKIRAKLGEDGGSIASLMAQGAENAGAALRRISDIVARLKRFSRLDAAALEPLDVGTALRDAAAILRHEAAAAGDVRIEAESDLVILCWASRVNQVFLHVLRNAVQSVEATGTVRVSAVRGPASSVHVTVRDDGHGIPAEDLPRIFEPGFTAKGGKVRAGLGLATSYQIVADHGGEIRIESELGLGTCVTIVLPAEPPASTA
jgi:signal transduction histidine kinase